VGGGTAWGGSFRWEIGETEIKKNLLLCFQVTVGAGGGGLELLWRKKERKITRHSRQKEGG